MKEPYFEVETWLRDDEKTVAYVVLMGLGKEVRNLASDMFYEIIGGEGIFEVDGKIQAVRAGSKVEIPRRTVYRDEGNLAMIVTSTPPFQDDMVEMLS